MIQSVKLKTLHMFDEHDPNDVDYKLWKQIAAYMDGEIAWVIESASGDGRYLFLGLKDEAKNKELFYLIEQDHYIGCFINNREGFDKAWDLEEYEHEGCFYLEPEYLVFEPEN